MIRSYNIHLVSVLVLQEKCSEHFDLGPNTRG